MQGYLKKWNSNSHGARPVHLIIKMIKWIRTTKVPSLYPERDVRQRQGPPAAADDLVLALHLGEGMQEQPRLDHLPHPRPAFSVCVCVCVWE